MRPVVVAIAVVLAVVSAGCGRTTEQRVSFEMVAYRFNGGTIEVDSQRPGDPGCFTGPKLAVTNRSDGLHLQVTYRQTRQRFCITPCPLSPLTQRQPIPAGSTGRPVILDPPQQQACRAVTDGPRTVPSG